MSMKNWLKKLNSRNIPWILVCLNILTLVVLFGKYIDGNVTSALHPFFGDSKEYIDAAELWIQTGDFAQTFSSGWRLPGYPFFILIVYKIAGLLNCHPLLLVRIFQLILCAFIPYFSYKGILNFSKSPKAAFLGALIICFYYPFYYFSVLISAESISIFLISILLWQISFIAVKEIKLKDLFFIGLSIALLTYMKPNHILFSVPVGILLITKSDFFSVRIFRSIVKPLTLALIIIAMLLPWVVFISNQNKMFIPLATTSGVDMVIGAGVPMNRNNPDVTSLTYKFEKKYNLIADTVLMQDQDGLSVAERNNAFQSDAIAIWKSRPWLTFKYALVKIAHSMGLGFRGAKDYFSFMLIFSVLGILICSKKFRKENKHLAILTGVLFLLLCLQTFVYFGDMRLRILLFDMPVIYILSIFIYGIWEKRFGSRIF
jgi:Dolichyl-phosphate-mannose-protein mannosyltransferase